MKGREKAKTGVLIIFALLVIAALMAPVVKKNLYSDIDADAELSALPSDITLEDLRQKGYIDVSQVMDSQNKKIEAFLDDVRNRRASILRIVNATDVNEQEDKLCAEILVYDKNYDAIVRVTKHPNQQEGSGDRYFRTEAFSAGADNAVEIWLRGVPNPNYPSEQQTPRDELLYVYAK